TVLEQGRAAGPEIANVKARAEQFAKDNGVAIGLAIFDPGAKGDAVTHAGHADGALIIGGVQGGFARVGATGKAQGNREANVGKEKPFHSSCAEFRGE